MWSYEFTHSLSGSGFSTLLKSIDCTELFFRSFLQVSERHYSFQIKGSLKESVILAFNWQGGWQEAVNVTVKEKTGHRFYFFFNLGLFCSCIFPSFTEEKQVMYM